MDEIGKNLRERGWRQGIILPAADVLEGLPDGSPVTEDDHVMVVSQSCDLLHHDIDNEPHAIFLLLRKIEAANPEVTHGKNPRLIHFPAPDGGFFEAWAWNQVWISRANLEGYSLDKAIGINPRDLRHILDWLAKRFTRIAFPDAFNEALRVQSGKIRKLLKTKHTLFSEILLRVEPFDEIEAGGQYQLACYLLMPAEQHVDAAKLKEAREVASKLERLFAACDIEVLVCSTASEAEITYAELQELVRWDFDHLTHKESKE